MEHEGVLRYRPRMGERKEVAGPNWYMGTEQTFRVEAVEGPERGRGDDPRMDVLENTET